MELRRFIVSIPTLAPDSSFSSDDVVGRSQAPLIGCNAVIDYNDSIATISGALDMAVLTVRNLDEDLKTQLRIKAAADDLVGRASCRF